MLGRFLQTDPIGTKDDLNLYAYVYNDSVNKRDPDGETAVAAGVAVVAVVIVGAAVVSCQAGSACNDTAIEGITSAGEGIGDARDAIVTSLVDTIVAWQEGRAEAREHRKNKRPSTKEKHQKGQERQKRDKRGGEKGDERRKPFNQAQGQQPQQQQEPKRNQEQGQRKSEERSRSEGNLCTDRSSSPC